MSDFLSELETFPDLEGSIIRATKIHKVLKEMLKLPSIPLDEEYQFKTRSIDLLAKWNVILSNDPPSTAHADEKADDTKPESGVATINGTSKGTKRKTTKAGTDAEGADTPDEDVQNQAEEVEKEKVKDEEAAEREKPTDEEESDEPGAQSAPGDEDKPSEEAVDEDSN